MKPDPQEEAIRRENIRALIRAEQPQIVKSAGGWTIETIDGYYGPFKTRKEAKEMLNRIDR